MWEKVCIFAASFRTGRIEIFVSPGQRARLVRRRPFRTSKSGVRLSLTYAGPKEGSEGPFFLCPISQAVLSVCRQSCPRCRLWGAGWLRGVKLILYESFPTFGVSFICSFCPPVWLKKPLVCTGHFVKSSFFVAWYLVVCIFVFHIVLIMSKKCYIFAF